MLGLAALLVWCVVRMQVQLLQQERSSEAAAANPDQEAALEAAIRSETDFLMQVRSCMWLVSGLLKLVCAWTTANGLLAGAGYALASMSSAPDCRHTHGCAYLPPPPPPPPVG